MPASKDALGDRMKADYETRTRYLLPRRTYTLLRMDGKAFHTYTQNCARPFDLDLMADMDEAARAVCERFAGAQFAFVQSDEISVLLTDFATPQTEAYVDGNLQKLCSLSASVATAHFNRARQVRQEAPGDALAYFDSRVWTIPQTIEVYHYFLWRQQDASRNSVSMTARAHFPHKRVENLSVPKLQELLWQEKNINWNDLPTGFKRGRVIERVARTAPVTYTDKRTGETRTAPDVTRHTWQVNSEPPIFSQDRDWLLSRIPVAAG